MYDLILKRNVLKIRVKNKYDVKKNPFLTNFKKKYKKYKKIFLL